jgi:NADP-dependent 3-hydroxy acid dehydrogenase YdfG
MVREFAKHGANIGLLARGIDGLNAAKDEVEACGSQALVVPTDVANADAVEAAAQQIEDHFGKIDVWINNAMVSVFGPFKELNAKDYKRVTDVTYHGRCMVLWLL